MNLDASSLNALLERLSAGDETAAAEAFKVYEPYLRMVIRRQLSGRLRAKFDSIDIVQSVWADLLSGFRAGAWKFTDGEHLRAFLIKVTRNRFLNRVRDHRGALDREQSLGEGAQESVPSPRPQPSAIAEADELWDQILLLCPPAHRALLGLKRQGYSLDEMATRVGLHPSSIRRILYQLASDLAERLPDEKPAKLLSASFENG